MRYGRLFLLVVALATAAAAPAGAQDPPDERAPAVTSAATVDFLSHYVWRGLRLSDGFVVQPSVVVESRGFSANLWWNLARASSAEAGPSGLTETDVTLAYTRALGPITEFSGGVVYYGNRGAPDTTELYASLSREMLLNPSFTLNYDVDEGDGALALLSLSQDLPLSADVFLSLSAAASYNMNHKVMGTLADGEPFAGFYHGEVGLSVSAPLGRHLTVAPRLLWSFPLTDKAREAMEGASYDGRTSSLVSGGIGLVIEF